MKSCNVRGRELNVIFHFLFKSKSLSNFGVSNASFPAFWCFFYAPICASICGGNVFIYVKENTKATGRQFKNIMEYNSVRLSGKQFIKMKVLTYFYVLISEGTDAYLA